MRALIWISSYLCCKVMDDEKDVSLLTSAQF